MEPITKKRKSCVFSVEDQIKLLELIEQEKGIVENKTTNKVSNEEKDLAWDRIEKKYNAIAMQHRSIEQLKSKFDNLKTKARKVVAEQKNYSRGTGGGPPVSTKFDILVELVLKIINYKTVVGFNNPFDGDADESGSNNTEGENIPHFEIIDSQHSDRSISANLDVFLSSDPVINAPPQSTINLTTEETCRKQNFVQLDGVEKCEIVEPSGSKSLQVHTPAQSNWSNYTPRKLKEPVSKKLRPAVLNPVILAKEKYYKMKALDLEDQMKCRKEKHEKEMILLDLEIKLKEKQLQKQ